MESTAADTPGLLTPRVYMEETRGSFMEAENLSQRAYEIQVFHFPDAKIKTQ